MSKHVLSVIAAALCCVVAMSTLLGCAATSNDDADPAEAATPFAWRSAEPGELDLYVGDRRAVRYMFAYDTSTPKRQHETYKVYHHVYDETGERPLTKGPGGLYTHHRGLFLGFSRLGLRGQEMDFWHMKSVTQRHDELLELTAGDDGAAKRVVIHWCDAEGRAVLKETRTLTAHATEAPGLLLVDVRSELTPILADVRLDGDPEHAGFQYRAHNAVAEGSADVKAVYTFPGEDVDPTSDVDLPWAAMTYGLYGKRYHVLHMNHPDNPTPTYYSAYRDYGRFGAFPVLDIARGETGVLRYGVYVGLGELPERAVLRQIYRDYVSRNRPNTAPSTASEQ
jgi:hypothetical protein